MLFSFENFGVCDFLFLEDDLFVLLMERIILINDGNSLINNQIGYVGAIAIGEALIGNKTLKKFRFVLFEKKIEKKAEKKEVNKGTIDHAITAEGTIKKATAKKVPAAKKTVKK